MYFVIGAAIIGGGIAAYSSSKASKANAKATSQANAANIAANEKAHTMTPEEKAAFFNTGMAKINTGFNTSIDATSRALAQRGLGGNAAAMPLAAVGRGRAAAVGDLYSGLVSTQMNMRASTPPANIQPAYSGPGAANLFLNTMGNTVANAGAYGSGKLMDKYFKSKGIV
jgi:hypothetical protein